MSLILFAVFAVIVLILASGLWSSSCEVDRLNFQYDLLAEKKRELENDVAEWQEELAELAKLYRELTKKHHELETKLSTIREYLN